MNGQKNGSTTNGSDASANTGALTGTMRVKAGLAQMLKGGVIMGETILDQPPPPLVSGLLVPSFS